MIQETMIDIPTRPKQLRLEIGKDIISYKRYAAGKPMKIFLRDRETGKRIATVFAGRKIAERIVLCVNKEGF